MIAFDAIRSDGARQVGTPGYRGCLVHRDGRWSIAGDALLQALGAVSEAQAMAAMEWMDAEMQRVEREAVRLFAQPAVPLPEPVAETWLDLEAPRRQVL